MGRLSRKMPITVYNTIDSTNTQAKLYAEQSPCKRAVFIAAEQTAGRGRLGRTFISEKNKGLYLSLLLGEKLPAEFAASLTTYMAVIAARSIEKLLNVNIEIKWVNDLYLGKKKLAGILTEGRGSADGKHLDYAVVGIGINLLKQAFTEDVSKIATTLESESGKRIDPNGLAAAIIKDFFDSLHLVGSNEIANEYKRRSFLIGKDVTVIKPTAKYDATVMDITEKCELVLRLADGSVETLSTDEVSVRAKELDQ